MEGATSHFTHCSSHKLDCSHNPIDKYSRKSNKFIVLYYNARSLLHNLDDLKSNIPLYKPDILCIVETWLDNSIDDKEISIPGYHSIRLNRNRHGGGIAIILYVSQLT